MNLVEREGEGGEDVVHVVLRAVADDGDGGDTLVAVERREVADDDPDGIVHQEELADDAAFERGDHEVRGFEFAGFARQVALRGDGIDRAGRCADGGLQIRAGLRIEDGHEFAGGEAEIDAAVSHCHVVGKLGLVFAVGGPEGGDPEIGAAVGPRDRRAVFGAEFVKRGAFRIVALSAEDEHDAAVRGEGAAAGERAAPVRPADRAGWVAGYDGVCGSGGEGPAEKDQRFIGGGGAGDAAVAAEIADGAAELEREAIVNDCAPRVLARRERSAAGGGVPRGLVIACGEWRAGEELAGERAVGAVDIERDEAGALGAEADGHRALRDKREREEERERFHVPGLTAPPAGGVAVNWTGSLHRL